MSTLHSSRKTAIAFHLALVALVLAWPAFAQETTIELDSAHTQIVFTLGDVFHTVHGTFKLKRGTVRFDTGTGRASGLVVVDATSGDSGSRARDRKMHKDVLESASFPEITFAPQQVQGQVPPQGDFKVQVIGTFTMHGTTRPLTLVVQAHVERESLTADTQFTISYSNWGVKNPSTLFLRVNDTVDITIHSIGQIQSTSTH